MMNYYLHVLKNYAVFSGRARRKEFWMFTLINFFITMGAFVLDMALNLNMITDGFGIIQALYTLFVLIPSLAVTVRRLHDVGKSGWFYFIILIPLIGAIWLLILFCKDSEPGANKYGENPKQIEGYQTDFA